LSNNTVTFRIADMACHIKSQLIKCIKASPVFVIQLDESVDSANFSQLMVGLFFQSIHNKTIDEDFRFCHPLETMTKASDVLNLVEDFLQQKNRIGTKLEVFAQMGHLLCSGCNLAFLYLSNRKILK